LDERGLPPVRAHGLWRGKLPGGRDGHILAARLDQPEEATFERFLADRAITRLRQYAADWKEARRPVLATSSRQATRRSQARHTVIRASSVARSADAPARRATSAADRATGVVAVAGSSGHPVPGGTGESKNAPVMGCGSDMSPLCTRAEHHGAGFCHR